jgi:hypothetical protein
MFGNKKQQDQPSDRSLIVQKPSGVTPKSQDTQSLVGRSTRISRTLPHFGNNHRNSKFDNKSRNMTSVPKVMSVESERKITEETAWFLDTVSNPNYFYQNSDSVEYGNFPKFCWPIN